MGSPILGGIGWHWFSKLSQNLLPEVSIALRIYGVKIVSPNGHEARFKFKNDVGAVLNLELWSELML